MKKEFNDPKMEKVEFTVAARLEGSNGDLVRLLLQLRLQQCREGCMIVAIIQHVRIQPIVSLLVMQIFASIQMVKIQQVVVELDPVRERVRKE